MKKKIIFVLVAIISTSLSYAKQFEMKSPDNNLSIKVEVGNKIVYSLYSGNQILIHPSEIAMILDDGMIFGADSKINNVKQSTVDQYINSPFYKKSQIRDNYNELAINFRENYSVVFRVYNEGAAYRFISTGKKDFIVKEEIATFNFGKDLHAYIPYVRHKRNSIREQFFNSFEYPYTYQPISNWEEDRMAFLPLVVESDNGKKICITESDLTNYPGMYLHNFDKSNTLKAIFAPYPKKVEQGGYNKLQEVIKEYDDFIAKSTAKNSFPWRIIIVASEDKELTNSDMVYKLARPCQIEDLSWIKPGKVAWEWWNAWNLYGVDFKSGINNDTYKYYIDFASKNNIEYVIFDEGWSVKNEADLYKIVPELNLPELVRYANGKNVGLILWAGYYAFDKDVEGICKHYSEMGIKGFKVDFMDRDDQEMVRFHYRAAEIAAKYHMLLDYHGTYKPTGLQRTLPNAINFEGVYGQENVKWNKDYDQVTYEVIIPFIRQVAGPMDYTQGAMKNATKVNYRAVNSEAMSQGTRCRQLAQYVIFESPLNMLCDSPSNYENEQECTNFITNIPTVWDETVALNGKIGEYVSIARKKGDEWYVGSLTNWDARDLDLDLSFLGNGNFKMEVFKDGINADKAARDYNRETISVPADKKLKINMAPGGGWAARIYSH